MSYRNPQIIVDRSAEIWAQGVGKIGETISAGITNYYKAKKLAKEKNDKLANANSKLLTEIQLNYNKSITDAKNAIKGSGVLQKQVRNNIQKIGDTAKEAHSMLATNPNISREQRASYLSAINNYNEYSSNTVSGSMKVSSGTEVLAQPITTLVNGYSPSYGDDLSSFIAANAVKEIAIPGITSSVTVVPTENNSNILTVNSKLKVDSDIYNAYKDAGIIDDKSYPEKDGYIDIKFERDLADWDGAFFDKIINAPDGNKALVDGGVKNKKGQINPKYVYSNLTTRTEGGLVYTEQVVDIASIQDSKAYNDIVKSQAAGLSIYDIKQQQQYIKGVLGWGDDVVKKYAEVDPKKKQNFLEDELKMKNIDMLGRRREVTDEDVKRIPGLSKTVLVGGEEQPNYIYTIPHGGPTAVEKEKENNGLTAAQIKFKNKVDFASEVLDEVYSLAGETKDRGNKAFTIDEQGAFLTILNEKRLATDEKIVNTEELKSQFINQYKADDFTQEDAEAAWEEQSPNTTLAYMKGRNIIGVDLSNPNNIRKTIIELLNPGIKSGEVDRILKATNNFKSKNPLLNN